MNEEFKIDVKHVPFKDVELTSTSATLGNEESLIDTNKERYPLCIVWTALPGLTNCLPFIGHTGICTQAGVINDFAASYRVNVDNLAFGKPIRYVQLEPDVHSLTIWDEAIEKANTKFRREPHNIVTNNCHHHVAFVLNQAKYKGRTNWTIADVWFMVNFKSKNVIENSPSRVMVGFLFFIMIIVILNMI